MQREQERNRSRRIPKWITPERISETIRVWQPYCKERLTEDDAVEMLVNVGRLGEVLLAISERQEREARSSEVTPEG